MSNVKLVMRGTAFDFVIRFWRSYTRRKAVRSELYPVLGCKDAPRLTVHVYMKASV